MIAIKHTSNQETLLISFDGYKRYIVKNQLLEDAGLKLGSICRMQLDNNEPRVLTAYKHPSGIHFDVYKKSIEGRGSRAILRKGEHSVFFESRIFGRVACVQKNISISNINKELPIRVKLISENDRIGENSSCHWSAVIDEENTSKPKLINTTPKQCTGVVTKVDIDDKNVKTYWCWLTDEHSSSAVFETLQNPLNLQRGDFFHAMYRKSESKWLFASFIERIPSLATVKLFNNTISLNVCLQKVKHSQPHTEAFHPLVGKIVDIYGILKPSAKNGIEARITQQNQDGVWIWVIVSNTA